MMDMISCKISRKRVCLAATAAAGVCLAVIAVTAQEAKAPQSDRALERTRKTVRMLDDIYKAAVVLITDKYVNSEDDFPAGSAAIALFDAVKQKGWHEVKLLDVSGEPYDDKNVPQDDFEKSAGKELRAGKDYLDRIEKRDDGRYLRAATPIPVVLPKCVMCHENYQQAKPGEPIGMLSYTLKIE